MQKPHHIQKLLRKFVLNQCNKLENEEVIAYFQKSKTSTDIPSVEDVLSLLENKEKLRDVDANRIYENVFQSIKKEENKVRKKTKLIWKYAAAAILIGVLATSYLLKHDIDNPPSNTTTEIATTTIETGKNKATLTLIDGSTIALEKGNNYQTRHVSSNGEKLVYNTKKQNLNDIAYHYLTIPRGGTFYIVLSDSTEIWLNSESQLKYPIYFTEGKTREVELVYGEAYFNVSPSTKHAGAKFKVINKSQDIEVLGTQFNIKAYKDETNIYTTLVEGKVSVTTLASEQILKPSQQSIFNLITNTVVVNKVDTYNETSWKEGFFSFRRKPLVEIMKVLSRWYDIDVNFANSELENAGFNGVLGKDQNIEDILKTIKNFGIIEQYKIMDKTIFLK